MPASLNASILAAEVPFPPLTMAPAWPMRRPGGAVAPAMKPATGFRQWLRSRPRLPPRRAANLPDHDDAVRARGRPLNSLMISRWDVPLTGSPPIPTHVDFGPPRGR